MSTLATADLSSGSSDEDFVPVAPKPKRLKRKSNKTGTHASGSGGSGSGSSSEGEDDGALDVDRGEAKRLKVEAEEAEQEARARKAKDLFATFQAGGGGDEKGKAKAEEEGGAVGVVEVKRARRFAGETIYETVSLPANDPEAIAFLRSQSSAPSAPSTPSTSAASTNPTLPAGLDTFSVPPDSFPEVKPGQTDSVSTDSPAASTTNQAPPTLTTPAPRPPVPVNKAAIRRKPRQSLEQMAAGLKGKKMTTLEKSQMDWKSHLDSSTNVRDELEANRRSGGYLEKKEFLDRVGDRRAESWDKSGRR